MVGLKKISDIKNTFGDVAQSSHYQVTFNGFSGGLTQSFANRGVLSDFYNEDLGLLCYSAVLPGQSLATTTIEGNFTGVQQQYAHTKIFNNINLSFYCDSQYQVLRFFEAWISYISGGADLPNNVGPYTPGYFYRMKYPRGLSGYKCDSMRIYKFDRGLATSGAMTAYSFVQLFPIAITSTPVSYESSNSVLRLSVDFNYERHFLVSRGKGTLSPYPYNNTTTAQNFDDKVIEFQNKTANSATGTQSSNANLSQFFTNSNYNQKTITQDFIDGFLGIKGQWNPTVAAGSDKISFISNASLSGGSVSAGRGAGSVTGLGGAGRGAAGRGGGNLGVGLRGRGSAGLGGGKGDGTDGTALVTP